jgi:hypothetical protein
MARLIRSPHGILAFVVLGMAGMAAWWLHGASPSPRSDPGPAARVRAALAKLPVYFVENQGQEDPRVAFAVRGREADVYFAADGVTFSVRDRRARLASAGVASTDSGPSPRWTVKLEFLDANPVAPVGRDVTPARFSYFTGPRSQWKTVRTYGAVVYEELWPGIDMVYDGAAGRMKYSFLVKPGADPSRIRLAYRGSTGVTVSDAGELRIATPAGVLSEAAPYSYQEVNGRRVEVATSYALSATQSPDASVVGFRLGDYDANRPLILDPATFVYVGYIGGSDEDFASGVAVDGAGSAYVTGGTSSSVPSFPAQVGPSLVQAGGRDAFVAKVSADGTGLVYAGFIGGAGNEAGRGIAVDTAGNAYIVGETTSTEATFPVTIGPGLVHGGDVYAFVVKVSADGTALVYCGYVGGVDGDFRMGIAVDATGHAYVTGTTSADPPSFPVSGGPSLVRGGDSDAFVAKVAADGSGLVYAGYIGGAGADEGRGIAVDAAGHAYVTGATASNQATFPTLLGPRLVLGGGFDGFVAKVRPDGTGLVYAGYIGGDDFDRATGVAVDTQGNAYVVGDTDSSAATFPVTVGPSLVHGGISDAFVAKVRADGTGFAYAGYIGGGGITEATGVAVDQAGNAYVAGRTGASQNSFPVRSGPDLQYNGGTGDAFVAKVRADGGGLSYAGYIGGTGSADRAHGIAVDSAGSAYVVGVTESTESSFPVQVGPSLVFSGTVDAFVAKIDGGSGPDLVVTAVSDPPATATVGSSFSVTVTVQNQGLANSGSSQTRFFLSLDAEKSADDVQLTGTRSAPQLASGATATGNASLTVPDTVSAGSFFLLACADAGSAVTESEEANNCEAAGSRVEIQLADLILTGVSHTGGPFAPGSQFSVTETTMNAGAAPTGRTSETRFYLSTDPAKSDNDVRLTGSHGVGNLAANATSTRTTQVTIPNGTPEGTYNVLVCADDTARVTESVEFNNCRVSDSGTIALGLPNLRTTIERLGVSGALRPGQSFQIRDTVRNDAVVAAGRSTVTRYLLSRDATRDGNDISLGTRNVSALGPGAASTVNRTLTIPTTVAPSQYFVFVCADDAGALAESNETDNCAISATPIVVARPDLVEEAVSASPSPVARGGTLVVSDTTRNAGAGPAPATTTRYYLSLDGTKSANDTLLLGTKSRPELAPGATAVGGRNVTVPFSAGIGAYFVLACADDRLDATESNEGNNCTATATRIVVTF